MTKYLPLAPLLASLCVADGDNQWTTTTCKTMSFNVRTSNAGDSGLASWDARKSHAVDALVRLAPDFVGTQEATQTQYEYIRDNLNVHGYAVLGECAGECTGANERVFILYDSTKWDRIDNGDFALSDTPDVLGSNTWGLVYNRMATWGRFRHKQQGDMATVCFLNTHFDMNNGHLQSAKLISEKMKQICQPHDLVVLTGDLNATPDQEPVQYLLGDTQETPPLAFVSALDEAHSTGGTFIGSFTAPVGDIVFDYVLARQDDDKQLCIEAAEIVDERFDGDNAISDHALVMATFCVGGGCGQCVNKQQGTGNGTNGVDGGGRWRARKLVTVDPWNRTVTQSPGKK